MERLLTEDFVYSEREKNSCYSLCLFNSRPNQNQPTTHTHTHLLETNVVGLSSYFLSFSLCMCENICNYMNWNNNETKLMIKSAHTKSKNEEVSHNDLFIIRNDNYFEYTLLFHSFARSLVSLLLTRAIACSKNKVLIVAAWSIVAKRKTKKKK